MPVAEDKVVNSDCEHNYIDKYDPVMNEHQYRVKLNDRSLNFIQDVLESNNEGFHFQASSFDTTYTIALDGRLKQNFECEKRITLQNCFCYQHQQHYIRVFFDKIR